MKTKSSRITRRDAVKQVGLVGAVGAASGTPQAAAQATPRRGVTAASWAEIGKRIQATRLIDTHEHLMEESDRLIGKNPRMKSNDRSFLLAHYANSDLVAAGMPPRDYEAFFGPGLDAVKKWELLAPYWPAIRRTGYGQAVQIAMKTLYGIDELSRETVPAMPLG
ncbi:MAG: twin-arginine translocation signal domain-containing protein [Acidobacteriota bacterium]